MQTEKSVGVERVAVECAEGICVRTTFDPDGDILRVETETDLKHKGAALGGWAPMIDHTLLKPDATAEQVRKLCEEAKEFGFASVCVNPTYVSLCAGLLQGTPVKVCSVVGFPLGATPGAVKAFETQTAIADGAQEIDMVINIGALKSGDLVGVAQDIRAVVRTAHQRGALVKVIIEAVLLSEEEKVLACLLAKEAGADFVKTSTGFSSGGATAEDVALMRRVVGPNMGVKAAGGVRTLEDAEKMAAAGATRLGASAGVKIVEGEKEENRTKGY